MKRLFRSALALWNAVHPTVAATLIGVFCGTVLRGAGLEHLADHLSFPTVLFRGFLPFLLFAGALHIDRPVLRQVGAFVAVLSSLGVVVTTLIAGYGIQVALAAFGRDVPLIACLLFGALIAPTDPIAVLAIFRRAEVPISLSTIVGAESLFNDGFAVVLFASILGASQGAAISIPYAAWLFMRQTVGGLALGLLLGAAVVWSVRTFKGLETRLCATALLAYTGYSWANACGASGLLTVIVAGICAGGRDLKLTAYWAMADLVLNSAVFALLGVSVAAIPWTLGGAFLGIMAVLVTLGARAASVALSMAALKPWREFSRGTFRALTWGGLRGAIPLALALSLPPSPDRALILVLTRVVCLFSLVVQGSTL